jgi:hypothetical protein
MRLAECPDCTVPNALLVAHRLSDGRLFLECNELECSWWHPSHVGPSADFYSSATEFLALMPERELATIDDIRAAGWDLDLFEVIEQSGEIAGPWFIMRRGQQ